MLKATLISQQETDEKLADARLKVAMVESAQATVHRLEELMGFAHIVAPFDGTITARRLDVGQLVAAGNGTELFRLSQTRTLRVFVRVPQTFAGAIAVPPKLRREKGCPACRHTGFRGRTTIGELLVINDDVRKHIPELPKYRAGHLIRVSDLLQHVSGLPDYMDFENVPARHKNYWLNEDYVPMFAKRQTRFPLDFPTGEKYEYNNTNYMLLAVVVERVSQKSFGTFLHDEVFVPVGMPHSFVYENPAAIPQLSTTGHTHALGYEKGKKQAWKESWGTRPAREESCLTVGDGGLWTNLDDMAAWDAALREGKLLKPETMRLALTPSKTRDGETNDYGFGWSIYPGNSGRMNGYGHEGTWGGFETSYYRDLLADRTTVLLSNRGNFDTDKFWYSLNAMIEEHLPQKQ